MQNTLLDSLDKGIIRLLVEDGRIPDRLFGKEAEGNGSDLAQAN